MYNNYSSRVDSLLHVDLEIFLITELAAPTSDALP